VPVTCIFTGIAHSATGTLPNIRPQAPPAFPVDEHLQTRPTSSGTSKCNIRLNLVLDVHYVGNHGYDLFVINPWVNARHLAGGCPGSSAPAKRFEPDQQRHLELQPNHRLVITMCEVGPAVPLQLHLQPHERRRVERRRAAIQRPKRLRRRVLER